MGRTRWPTHLPALTPAQREQANGEVLAAIWRYYDGQLLNFPAVVVVAAGERAINGASGLAHASSHDP
jgi:hypothetical protein